MLLSYVRFKPNNVGYFSNFPEDIKNYLREEQKRRIKSVAMTPVRKLKNKAMIVKWKIKRKEVKP